jgi:hypothetical protein
MRGGRKPRVVEDNSTREALLGELVPIPRAPLWFNRIFSVPCVIIAMLLAAGLEKPVLSKPSPNV